MQRAGSTPMQASVATSSGVVPGECGAYFMNHGLTDQNRRPWHALPQLERPLDRQRAGRGPGAVRFESAHQAPRVAGPEYPPRLRRRPSSVRIDYPRPERRRSARWTAATAHHTSCAQRSAGSVARVWAVCVPRCVRRVRRTTRSSPCRHTLPRRPRHGAACIVLVLVVYGARNGEQYSEGAGTGGPERVDISWRPSGARFSIPVRWGATEGVGR